MPLPDFHLRRTGRSRRRRERCRKVDCLYEEADPHPSDESTTGKQKDFKLELK